MATDVVQTTPGSAAAAHDEVGRGLSVAIGGVIVGAMGVIEFELERTIRAPIEAVFSRLVDINGYDEWMPQKGSILRHTQQTSARR